MLPYLPPPVLQFSQFTVHIFELMVLSGILMMRYVINKQVAYRQLDPQIGHDIFLLGVCVALPLSHVFDVLWGSPHLVLDNPLLLLQLNRGIDSFGGFLGFAIAFYIYRHVKKLQGKLIPYMDCTAYALCFGWIFCRLGCAFSHDHPGNPSHSLLAIDYPADLFGGIPRHNLGMDEALGVFVIFLIITFLNRKKQKDGVIVATLLLLYSPFRFFLDFLRATDLPVSDIRYWHLTPAQWGSLAVFLLGIYILRSQVWTASKARRSQTLDLSTSQQ